MLNPGDPAPWFKARYFCRLLIELYEKHGGRDSGFMRNVDGKTVELFDYTHKRRADYEITDPEVIKAAQVRLHRRLVPEILKAFQLHATGGHFNPHRDNSTIGTAHRRFGVRLNLNADEFEGGEPRFPEFGLRTYKARPAGRWCSPTGCCTRRCRSPRASATLSCRSCTTRRQPASGRRI